MVVLVVLLTFCSSCIFASGVQTNSSASSDVIVKVGNSSKAEIREICASVLQEYVTGLEFPASVLGVVKDLKRKEGVCFIRKGFMGRYDEDIGACEICSDSCLSDAECAADCSLSTEVYRLRGQENAFQIPLSVTAIGIAFVFMIVIIVAGTIYHCHVVSDMRRKIDKLNHFRNTHDMRQQQPEQADNECDKAPLVP